MLIGLIDVDGHNYPNLALMKLLAWHKAKGDTVEWWWGFGQYDRVYMSKVFDETYSADIDEPVNASEIIKGGTGYFRRKKDGSSEVFFEGRWRDNGKSDRWTTETVTYNEFLPYEVEHMCPDYGLYPQYTNDTAYGFLTRGCPRACGFCGVAQKEGRRSVKVADLSEFWSGQKYITLMDPNILAYPRHMELLQQIIDSKAIIDFNQGLDCRLLTEQNIAAINEMRIKDIHFAWDDMRNMEEVLQGLELYKRRAKHKPHGNWATVYCLTNFNTTFEQDLFRVDTLRDAGYSPYIMIYDKPNAPEQIRLLQRWVNNKKIFRKVARFEDYDRKMG